MNGTPPLPVPPTVTSNVVIAASLSPTVRIRPTGRSSLNPYLPDVLRQRALQRDHDRPAARARRSGACAPSPALGPLNTVDVAGKSVCSALAIALPLPIRDALRAARSAPWPAGSPSCRSRTPPDGPARPCVNEKTMWLTGDGTRAVAHPERRAERQVDDPRLAAGLLADQLGADVELLRVVGGRAATGAATGARAPRPRARRRGSRMHHGVSPPGWDSGRTAGSARRPAAGAAARTAGRPPARRSSTKCSIRCEHRRWRTRRPARARVELGER